MLTLQDLQKYTSEQDRIEFCRRLIQAHKASGDYITAKIAEEYYRQQNTTITQYRKVLYNLKGQTVPNIFEANYKLPSRFFGNFVTQQNQYLLGNGLSLTVDKEKQQAEKEKLGRDFDIRLQEAGRSALVHKVSFLFWNLDHVEVYRFTEFAPLYDEETGALGAGVRFWQLDGQKPLRFTLYEQDGYTDYIQRNGANAEVLHEKRPYKLLTRTSEVSGTEIYDGENYPNFPIVPMWGNPEHQSEIIGIRAKIDCYDLIESGFANDLDDASSVYWILHNTGGMDDIDLAQFVERMKTVKAAVVDTEGGAGAEAHTIEVPFAARETYLARLEADLYKDFSIVNVSNISAGSKTATEITAAYQPMDTKVDMYEYCITDALLNLFELAGVEGEPVFKRNRIANQTEETEMILSAAQYLDDEAILRHLPWLTPDEVDDLLGRRDGIEQEIIDGQGA